MLTRRTTLTGLAALGLTPASALAATPPARTLANAEASAGARTLYDYLWSQYGRHTLTGQQEQGYNLANAQRELAYLQRVTGRAPAILGSNYIEPRDHARFNARALAWGAGDGNGRAPMSRAHSADVRRCCGSGRAT